MEHTELKPTQKQRKLIIFCLVFLAGFLLVTFFRSSFFAVDITINHWIPTVQKSVLIFLAQGIALIFDTTSLVIISLIIAAGLFLKNYKAQGLLLLGAMGGDALLVSVIKALDHIARPINGIVLGTGFSYPSGHAAGSVVFLGILTYFALRHWHSQRSKVPVRAGMGVLVGVVGFDRLYLNVHWLSDVIGGWLFGAFWVLFAVLVFQRLEWAGKFKSKRFDLVANVLFVAAVGVSAVIIALGFANVLPT